MYRLIIFFFLGIAWLVNAKLSDLECIYQDKRFSKTFTTEQQDDLKLAFDGIDHEWRLLNQSIHEWQIVYSRLPPQKKIDANSFPSGFLHNLRVNLIQHIMYFNQFMEYFCTLNFLIRINLNHVKHLDTTWFNELIFQYFEDHFPIIFEPLKKKSKVYSFGLILTLYSGLIQLISEIQQDSTESLIPDYIDFMNLFSVLTPLEKEYLSAGINKKNKPATDFSSSSSLPSETDPLILEQEDFKHKMANYLTDEIGVLLPYEDYVIKATGLLGNIMIIHEKKTFIRPEPLETLGHQYMPIVKEDISLITTWFIPTSSSSLSFPNVLKLGPRIKHSFQIQMKKLQRIFDKTPLELDKEKDKESIHLDCIRVVTKWVTTLEHTVGIMDDLERQMAYSLIDHDLKLIDQSIEYFNYLLEYLFTFLSVHVTMYNFRTIITNEFIHDQVLELFNNLPRPKYFEHYPKDSKHFLLLLCYINNIFRVMGHNQELYPEGTEALYLQRFKDAKWIEFMYRIQEQQYFKSIPPKSKSFFSSYNESSFYDDFILPPMSERSDEEKIKSFLQDEWRIYLPLDCLIRDLAPFLSHNLYPGGIAMGKRSHEENKLSLSSSSLKNKKKSKKSKNKQTIEAIKNEKNLLG